MHEMSAPQRECADEVDLEYNGNEFETNNNGRISFTETFDDPLEFHDEGLKLEWVAVGGAPA